MYRNDDPPDELESPTECVFCGVDLGDHEMYHCNKPACITRARESEEYERDAARAEAEYNSGIHCL